LRKEATYAGKRKFAPCGIRNNTISAQQAPDGSLLRRNRDTSVLRFSAVPLLNDLKLSGSRGLAAVANWARLFGTADAYKDM